MSESALPRREFLRAACGAGLILGLGGLGRFGLAQDGGGARVDPGEVLAEAKRHMKRLRRHGIAIVVPADVAGQRALGAKLAALIPAFSLHQSLPPCARYLLSNVWVCAPGELVGAQPGETLVLLDPAGKRLAGSKVDLGCEQAQLSEALRALSEGEGRLAAQVARVREDAELARALDDLQAKRPERVERARTLLSGRAEEAAPAVFALLDQLPDESKFTLLHVLQRIYFERIQQPRGFPYGARFKVEVHEPEPCPPCGMAAPSVSGRTFLDFFTRDAK